NEGEWSLSEKDFQVRIAPGDTTRLQVTFRPPVLINSVPYGAEVWADSMLLGTTPCYLQFETFRGRLLQFRKTGFTTAELHLVDDHPITVFLKATDVTAAAQVHKPRLLGFLPRERIKSKFALLALTVGTHWAAFYFKNIADSHYEKYLHTADPRLIRHHWKATRKYDRLSDASLLVSYLSLSGLIYMVIWH
ncbi:MAG: hypothetical protein D6743_14080, partial [Calditrichaeota bacterium]